MDSLTFSLAASPVIAPSGAPALPASGGESVRGADFANLFKHLMAPAGRQDLAAVNEPPLQSLALSPHLNLITVDGPLPDNASLLAFARGQGLDDSTLSALFAPVGASLHAEAAMAQTLALPQPAVAQALALPEAALAQALALPEAAVAQALALPEAAVSQAQALPEVDMAQTLALPFSQQAQAQGIPTAVPLGLVASGPLQEEGLGLVEQQTLQPVSIQLVSLTSLPQGLRPGAEPVSASVSSAMLAARQLAQEALKLAGTTSAASQSLASAVIRPAAEQAVMAAELTEAAPVHLALPGARLSRQATGLAAPLAADAAALATAGADSEDPLVRAAAQVAANPAARQLMQDSLRLSLQPQQAITQRLAAMATTGEQAMWKQISTQSAGELETLSLGLGAEWVESDVLSATDSWTPHAQASPAAEALRSQAANSPELNAPASTAAERVAQYEQLAQRLGRALGDRLQAQIERGEWKVHLQMDPAKLGRIEMELDMRAGGLDAMFRSDNQVTRELIAQSLPRLRETLAQSGTAVANVWVQGESQRQSGGNPTPGRQGQSERGGRPSEEGTAATQSLTSRPRVPSSDWDLMA
jgi:flagellar hook-length control protein FliK